MTILCNADEQNPTHHVSLSDGTKTIGLILSDAQGTANALAINRVPVVRTALKTTSGNQKYSDFEPPWTPIAQDDFSGGRGQMDFEDDATRFFDSWRANTAGSKVTLGGQETYTTGYRSQEFNLPGKVTWMSVQGARKYMGRRFLTTSAFSAATISVLIRRIGTPTAALTVELCDDSAVTPGTVLQTATVTTTTITDVLSELHDFTITAEALLDATNYWVKVYSTAGDEENHWEVGVNVASVNTKRSTDNTTWTTDTVDLYFRVRDADTDYVPLFYQYKKQLYYVTKPDDNSAAKIYMNGDRGAAVANTGALTELRDTSKSWVTDEWAGIVVMIVGGTGLSESQPWRTITSNLQTAVVVDTPWTIEHDITTEYVFLGSNKWTEITGHGLTVAATDVHVGPEVVYFPQGDDVAIRRMNETNTAGVWAYAYADDGTNKAMFLCSVRKPEALVTNEGVAGGASNTTPIIITSKDNLGNTTLHGLNTGDAVFIVGVEGNTGANGFWRVKVETSSTFTLIGSVGNGAYTSAGTYEKVAGVEIWRANNKDANGKISVSRSPVVDWGTDMAFLAPINFDDPYGRITGLEEYQSDDQKQLFVLREGSVFAITADEAEEMPLQEMHNVLQAENGQAHAVHNVYFYFSFGRGGMERYYNRTLDDIGPNRDEGLPQDRQGYISSITGYPGRFYAAIDAGTTGTSSVLMWGGTGWHEIYRANAVGRRIRRLHFQVIPGSSPDRLWIDQGGDLIWIPFPSGTTDPTQDSDYRYTHESAVELSYMQAGMYDLYKLYNSLKLFTEDLDDGQTIHAEYKVDNDTTWTAISDYFDTSPFQELLLKDELGVNGKRMRVRLRLMTNDNTKTPKIKGIVLECVSRVPVKYSYGLSFRMRTGAFNLRSDPDDFTVDQIADQIDTWAENLTPLKMRCVHKRFDNKLVFIDPTSISPLGEKNEIYNNKLTVVEL